MIITFMAEMSMAVYTIMRYKMTEVTRLVVAMLVFLAIFQLAEYMVCEGSIIGDITWSRLGYASITMLPPLGIHMVYAIAKIKRRYMVWIAYMTAALFAIFFLGVSGSLSGHECLGNYVIFQVASGLGGLFGAYYYLWLAVAVALAWFFARQSDSGAVRRSLMGMILGYAAFIVPTATANIISPDTIRGIPSIMCGFAGVLSITLITLVLPGVAKPKERT